MSSVTTTVLEQPQHQSTPETITASPATQPFPQTCHQCGADLSHTHPAASAEVAEDAQRRISELETQVRILTGKATAAVDKLADYEDELRQLKSTNPPSSISPSPNPNKTPNISTQPPTPTTTTTRPTSSSSTSKSALPSRLSHLLPTSTRRTISTPDLHQPQPPQQPSNSDLLHQLNREQSLRQAAETRVSQTNDEIEELSAQLFSEANEMVATERKARAKLEERVAVLERRDGEKRGRLEALERRLGRIERVRKILGGEG